jgi:mono/diheme cytochrome c family protein
MLRVLDGITRKLLMLGCFALAGMASPALADAENGKTLAIRWCSECHVVQQNQRVATDQAPPFASLAKIPGFDASRLAFLVLKPHPNMPRLELSRAEATDLAAYIATLK